jgi:ABC-2 type transport system permease protein
MSTRKHTDALKRRAIWPLAKKELRGFFHSPVAVIFLAVFLVAVMVSFFFVDKFFARNAADIRPLFDRLPILLVFLVAALTMRMWSEEQKVGTLEVLLTLPIPGWKLVLGKFLAGFLLIAIALGLTLGVPITVEILGDLDWGPVIGGYTAALLLAGAYLAIGLCLSALTDNQIVALVSTTLACLVLYFIGTDVTTRGLGYQTAEILRSIGTGARFESVARGVIDIRDLVYWLSLIALFVSLNVFILRTKTWAGGLARASVIAPRRNAAKLAVALLAANMVAVNLWIAPVRGVRVDLTADNIYKLSPVTKNLLESVEEPLVIRGYFSEKTHPLVAPMVSEIRDHLEEYAAAGGENVRIEIVDPTDNEEAEKEAAEQYSIETLSFRFRDRHGASVVNAYFHVLVSYGDQHVVLGFDDLVEVRPVDVSDIELELNNFEYTLTGAIKKVALGFSSLEAMFATLGSTPKLTFYTSDQAPEGLEKIPETIEKVAKELATEAGGTIDYSVVKPTEADIEPLARKYGLQPRLVLTSGGAQAFYFDLVFEVGDRAVVIAPPQDGDENAIKRALTEAIKRGSPGFTKTVGLVTPPAPPQQPQPGMPPHMQPRPQPPQSFETLRAKLSDGYAVRPVNLASGRVDDAIDVLILAGPEGLGEKELRAVDQFLMRGGAVIALVGRYRINPQSAQTLELQPVDSGMGELLKSYGFDVESKLVMDAQASTFLVPIARAGRRPALFQGDPYPYAVRADRDQLDGHVVTNPLNAAVFHYASPVVLMTPQAQAGAEEQTVDTEALVKTTGKAWAKVDANIEPDFVAFPEKGFGALTEVPENMKGPFVLAAVATGSFTSHFASRPADKEGEEGEDKPPEGDGEPLLERSPPDARFAVVGSSSFVDDLVLRLADGAESTEAANNIDLVLNLVDWGLADTDLLEIRARGAHTRPLSLEEDKRLKWELYNYAIALLGLGLLIGVVFWRRRNMEPFELDRRARHQWSPAEVPGASSGDEEE